LIARICELAGPKPISAFGKKIAPLPITCFCQAPGYNMDLSGVVFCDDCCVMSEYIRLPISPKYLIQTNLMICSDCTIFLHEPIIYRNYLFCPKCFLKTATPCGTFLYFHETEGGQYSFKNIHHAPCEICWCPSPRIHRCDICTKIVCSDCFDKKNICAHPPSNYDRLNASAYFLGRVDLLVKNWFILNWKWNLSRNIFATSQIMA